MSNTNINIGPGFLGTLAIVFITLKILGKITWSWFWVLSPLWIGFAIFIFIMLIILIGLAITGLLE